MGKSPGKWIKTLLFGKKSSRSNGSKKSAKDEESKNGFSALGGDSPVISHPLPVQSGQLTHPEPLKEATSYSPPDGVALLSAQEEVMESTNFPQSECMDKVEQATIKVQAAFRGYLARRAFRALWGIIRLQALFRGRLVRRQAITTLYCIQGIVKLQAIVRGHKVRQSDNSIELHTNFFKANTKVLKNEGCWNSSLPSWKENLSSNRFVNKLLSSTRVSKPLQMQYGENEPNSIWNWLERWTYIQIWKPAAVQKKYVDSKPKTRISGYALETESGRLKRGIRKNYPSDNGSTNGMEPEKSKRNLRKVSISTAEAVYEQPPSELEKVKRNLRKISSSYSQANDAAEGENERSKRAIKGIIPNASAEAPEVARLDSSEKAKKDNAMQPPEDSPRTVKVQSQDFEVHNNVEPDQKTDLDTKIETVPVDDVVINAPAPNGNDEAHPLPKCETHAPINGHLELKNENSYEETQKAGKRRASFSVKLENAENGSPKTSTIPSYMAATESAKAKLRGQISPRFSSDGIDKNGFARRHSLPSSANVKMGQRTDHPIRAEWRR